MTRDDFLSVSDEIGGESHPCRREYAKRDRTLGTDVDICFSGKIAITQLRV